MEKPQFSKLIKVLVVDDDERIQTDLDSIFMRVAADQKLGSFEDSLFNERKAVLSDVVELEFDLVKAYSGDEGISLVKESRKKEEYFFVAFIDLMFKDGIDGIEIAKKIIEEDRRIQIIICSAFSQYSWQEMQELIGRTQNLFLLKKPFSPQEALQLVTCLAERNVIRRELFDKSKELDDINARQIKKIKDLSLKQQILEKFTVLESSENDDARKDMFSDLKDDLNKLF